MKKKIPGKGKTVVKKQKNGDVVIIKKNSEVGYKKPPKHTQFKKGHVANPTGINVSPEKRALKELTVASVAEAIKKSLTCTEEEIIALLNDKTTPIGHKVILRAALQAAEHGEYGKFDHILERAIGKVSIKVDMTNNFNDITQAIKNKAAVKEALNEVENEY